MKALLSLLLVMMLFSGCRNPEGKVYLLSYFKDNGQDGLHLAFSRDGYYWNALKNDLSFLTPRFQKINSCVIPVSLLALITNFIWFGRLAGMKEELAMHHLKI